MFRIGRKDPYDRYIKNTFIFHNYFIFLLSKMPRKMRTSNEDILNKLKELLDNYSEIQDIEDKLTSERFVVNQQLEKCIIDIKNNIISKL